MQTRNTVIMAAVLIILAGFVYFYEIRGRENREEAERLAGLLVHFEIEQVHRVEVITADGAVVAEKADGEWAIVEPVAAPADGEAIDALVDVVHRATHERMITEAAEDLSTFGLDTPSARVTLDLDEGDSVTLALGKDTPVGFNLYASPGEDGAVYSATRSLRAGLDKKLFDLRDRTILSFEEADITSVEISSPDLTASLRRESGSDADETHWSATAPFVGSADTETVEDLLSALHAGEAEAFVLDTAPTAQQVAEYGLESPRVTIALGTADGATWSLLVGGESSEPPGHYAMRQSGGGVFIVAADLLDDIPARADALRNKQVLALARERVEAIDVQGGDGVTRLERDGVDWRITSPRPLEADASAVSRLLSSLQDLRAEGFGAAGALQDPELTLRLQLGAKGESGTPETIFIHVGDTTRIVPLADADSEDAEQIEVTEVRTSSDDTVYLVPAEDAADLRVDPFTLRAKTLIQFTQADLTAIDIDTGDRQYRLQKRDEAWHLVEPAEAELEQGAVSDLLWDLNYLRMEAVATEWSDGDRPDLRGYGLSQPRFRLLVRAGDDTITSMTIGDVKAGSGDDESARVYVTVGEQPAVFEIAASLSDTLEGLVEKLAGS